MSGQLVLLLTSPRVSPGLLTRDAWQVLEQADQVLCADAADAQPAALTEAGIVVRVDQSRSGTSDSPMLVLARELVTAAMTANVVWVGSPDADPGLTDALAAELSRVAAHGPLPAVEVLVASHDVPGARLLDLVAVMDRLRSPGGCPWDAEQTHESLVPYVVEEAFEVAEAVETGDRAAIREELGDLLLQVVFHSRVAAEHPHDAFDVDDVAEGIVAKLVSRHPHVFEDSTGEDLSAASVEATWEQLKASEKQRAHVLDGVPLALPALARADKVLGRLARAGLDEPLVSQDGIGEALLALVRRARAEGVDPEAALRERVRELESVARQGKQS